MTESAADKTIVLSRKFRIATYEVDPFGQLKPSAMMNYLQECADIHAKQWEVSAKDLMGRGKTWVISRYHFELLRRPKIGEEVEVSTWPSSRQESFVTRDFEVKGSDGQPVALATMSIVMLDLQSRRPVAISGNVPDEFLLERRAVDTTLLPLPKLGKPEHECRLPVMLRDLDINGHVNHVVYVQWGLESIPLEIWHRFHPRTIEVAYRAETHHGAHVLSRSARCGGTEASPQFLHQITHAETGQELARLRTTWIPSS